MSRKSDLKEVASQRGRISRKSSGFDFAHQLQRRLGKAAAGGVEPEGGSQAVLVLQDGRVRAMGGGIAKQFLELFALLDEARRVLVAAVEGDAKLSSRSALQQWPRPQFR